MKFSSLFNSQVKAWEDLTSSEAVEKAGKKISLVLCIAQAFIASALSMSFVASSLLVVKLGGGNPHWTGAPLTLSLIFASLTAFFSGRLSQRYGYRPVLLSAYAIGVTASLLSIWGAVNSSLLLFLLGMSVFGIARGFIDMSRYAAAESNPPKKQGRAIGFVIWGAVVGSILGPSLTHVSMDFAKILHCPAAGGAWVGTACLFFMVFVFAFFGLRPEPRKLASYWRKQGASPKSEAKATSILSQGKLDRKVYFSMATLFCAQWAMVLIMAITPLHMQCEHHSIPAISGVISAHFAGMFGLAFAIGWLIDKVGKRIVIALGSLLLISACLLAPYAETSVSLGIALFLLGLGWNCCFLSASTELNSLLQGANRGKILGMNESMVNLGSAIASGSGGFMFSAIHYSGMAWIALGVSTLPMILIFIRQSTKKEISNEIH